MKGEATGVVPGPRPLGAILAGGKSRRYGGAKALARVGGLTLIERARRALSPSTSGVILVANDVERYRDVDLPIHPDFHPGAGPLAGLEAALFAAAELGAPGAFVMACDLPLVPAELVRALVDRFVAAGGSRIVLPESGGPLGVEPLCACYPPGCLEDVRHALEVAAGGDGAGTASMIAFIRERDAIRVSLDELSSALEGGNMNAELAFLNVNRPSDRERAEGWLRTARAGVRSGRAENPE